MPSPGLARSALHQDKLILSLVLNVTAGWQENIPVSQNSLSHSIYRISDPGVGVYLGLSLSFFRVVVEVVPVVPVVWWYCNAMPSVVIRADQRGGVSQYS